MTRNIVSEMTYNVSSGTLNTTIPILMPKIHTNVVRLARNLRTSSEDKRSKVKVTKHTSQTRNAQLLTKRQTDSCVIIKLCGNIASLNVNCTVESSKVKSGSQHIFLHPCVPFELITQQNHHCIEQIRERTIPPSY